MFTPTRRSILSAAAACASATTLGPSLFAQDENAEGKPATPGRLLMIGGTAFLGPQIVNAAIEAGWEVTLFNRGKSNPELFPDLDKRVGDRNTADYASLAEGEWDLAIDTSCYVPKHVTALIDAIKGRVKHYVVVSTVSVYDTEGSDGKPVAEDSKLGTIDPETLAEFNEIRDIGKFGGRYYGALKALCESAAADAMPDGATTVVRPGLIVGPEDSSDRFTYWPVRVARGGEVLAPGNPDVGTQYIDVRDLGPFTLDVGARTLGGIFNAVGFSGKVTMKEMVESCIVRGEDAPETTITWVDDEFLQEQKVGPWMELPLWIPGGGDVYTNQRAIDEGLTFRSLEDTAAATLAWHKANRKEDHRWRAGLDPEKEKAVLAAWNERG